MITALRIHTCCTRWACCSFSVRIAFCKLRIFSSFSAIYKCWIRILLSINKDRNEAKTKIACLTNCTSSWDFSYFSREAFKSSWRCRALSSWTDPWKIKIDIYRYIQTLTSRIKLKNYSFPKRYRKAPFSWRIRVEGRPSRRIKLRFHTYPGMRNEAREQIKDDRGRRKISRRVSSSQEGLITWERVKDLYVPIIKPLRGNNGSTQLKAPFYKAQHSKPVNSVLRQFTSGFRPLLVWFAMLYSKLWFKFYH